MQILSKVDFQNSSVAYNASVFTISMISSLQTYISLELLESYTLFKNYRLSLLIFQRTQTQITDFSQVPFLWSILLLQLGATPPLMMYSNSSFFQFPF